MRNGGWGASRAAALLLAIGLVAGLGAAPAGAAVPPPTDPGTPGVTATTIRVGGVAARTGADGRVYEHALAGARAYFDLVNRSGGVGGRRIRLVATAGDAGDPARDVASVRELVERRGVFAVLPVATPSFAAAGYLATNAVPTFGWTAPGGATTAWSAGPTLFGDAGSYECLTCARLPAAFVAHEVGATRVAVVASPTPGAAACARGLQAAFARYGPPVELVDSGATAGANDAQKLHDLRVDFVAMCGDVGAAARLADALRGAGTQDAHLFVTDGYAPAAARRLGASLDGVYTATGFLPVDPASKVPGMRQFVAAMKAVHVAADEQALAGWLNAALFVAGLRAAGAEPTRARVVDAINAMTDDTADGILPGLDWSAAWHGPARTGCSAYVEVVKGAYVARFGQPGKPFVCFPQYPDPATVDAPTYR